MNVEEFASCLKRAVVDENMGAYKEIFLASMSGDVTDEYWQRAVALFRSLPSEQHAVFFDILRQVCVDTVSNVLGIIDGSVSVDGLHGDFSLQHSDEDVSMSGDLQDAFLAVEERSRR